MPIPLNALPDMPVRAFLSDKAVRTYIRRVSSESPSLGQLAPSVISRISEMEIAWIHWLKKFLLISVAILIADNLVISSVKPSTRYHGWITGSLDSAFLLGFIIAAIYLERDLTDKHVTWWLFHAVLLLEYNADGWGLPTLRNEMAGTIKRIANNVERLPYQFRHLAPDVRRELLRASRRKAQAIRELQHWVVTPGPFTYTDLIERLTYSLEMIACDRWRELPEADYQRRASRWLASVQVLFGLVVLGGALAIVVVIPKSVPGFAPAASIVTSILVAAAFALLIRAGLPLNLANAAIDAGSKLHK
jgi:hypothetical protein